MKLFIALLLVSLLVACAAQPQASLDEGTWVLTSLDGNTQVGMVVGGRDITLEFGEDGQSGGSGGCNGYGAGYTVSGNTVSFEQPFSTLMYCEPELIMQNEAAYLQALSLVNGYQISGTTLTLTGGGHTLVFNR
ncbi:MAG: META domain-containing protein [Anaerolineales bacterium]|nr:META domain-containing protein [Anaerolineales bacterium]